MNSKIFVLFLSALLFGCGAPQKHWKKDNTPHSASEQALVECEYQAEAATIGIGAGTHPRTFKKAVTDGIADGIERSLDEQELIDHCMRAKGFAR